jgi:ABC-type uncharacterized transport system substrate-binding protein
MDRRAFLCGLTLGILGAPLVVMAQLPKTPRIGLLSVGSATTADDFRQGLRELGYVEGQNIVIEYRWAQGRLDRLPELANDLVRLKVDVIVSAGVAATRAAKQATSTISIVMSAATDPLGAGLISSLARPGGNITGSAMLSELEAKRLELLTEALPNASRVVALYDPATSPTVLREAEAAAERLKLRFNVVSVRTPEDLDSAFRKAKEWQAAALAVLASPLFSSQRVRIAELALVGRLPAIFSSRLYVEAGGLMSYGPDLRAAIRHAAVLVDKILKGAKPADLPVEQPTKFELVINLKTAKALGLTIPQSLLVRADEIIQ